MSGNSARRRRLNAEWLVVLGLFALALAARLYQLKLYPYGLNHDEAFNGVDVIDILRGARPIFLERNLGREPLFMYLQALSVALLGPSPFAMRLVSAVAGALTVPAVYWLAREAFRGAGESRSLPTWAALFLATSYWHLSFSRLGLRAILLPLFASVTLALFWRAWRRIEAGDRFPWLGLVLCGFFTGASLYTYIAARFLPVLIAVLVVAGALLGRRTPGLAHRAAGGLAVIAAVALVVFAPLGIYFAANPDFFIGRSADVSVLNPEYNGGSALLALGRSALLTVAMFGAAADPSLVHNPAARPAVDLLIGIFFLGGAAVAITRRRSLPHLSLLVWVAIFALPAVLTADQQPHTLRAIGMLPAVSILIALGLTRAAGLLARPVGERLALRRLALWLPLPLLLISGFLSLRDYYAAWPGNQRLYVTFEGHFYDALRELFAQERCKDGAWIMGVAPKFYATSNIDFMINAASEGRIDYPSVPASETIAPERLTALTRGHRLAHLVEWLDPELFWDGSYANADPKRLLPFLLDKYGERLTETPGKALGYATYSVPVEPDYRVAGTTLPADISFSGEPRLTGFAFGRTAGDGETTDVTSEVRIPSGEPMWVVLRWQADAPVSRDLVASLRLEDEAGRLVGQVDNLLVGDQYPFERTWAAGEPASTYHILPLLPGVPPGKYRLRLAVYDPATMLSLPVRRADGSTGAITADVVEVEVTAAQRTQPVAPAVTLPSKAGSDLWLYGYDLPATSVDTGDTLPLTLYWQGKGVWDPSRTPRVALRGQDGAIVAERPALPDERGGGEGWPGDMPVRVWADLGIPPSAAGASYELAVTEAGETVLLGEVQVVEREHVMEPPAPGNALDLTVGGRFKLIGYDLSPDPVASGGELTVTLYWQSLGRADRPYTVFVHLLGPGEQVVAGQDNAPVAGTRPTTSWIEGEFLTDSYQLAVKADTPPGAYRIEVGMYDPQTGARLAIAGPGQPQADRFILPTAIQVK